MKATYEKMRVHLENALADLAAMSGDVVGPSDATWRSLAGSAAFSFRRLAEQLETAQAGYCEPMIVFPSPAEAIEKIYGGE